MIYPAEPSNLLRSVQVIKYFITFLATKCCPTEAQFLFNTQLFPPAVPQPFPSNFGTQDPSAGVCSCSPHVWWHRDFRATYKSSAKPLWHSQAHFSQHPTDLPSILLFLNILSTQQLMEKVPVSHGSRYQLPPSYCAHLENEKISKMIFITWFWVSFVLYHPYFSWLLGSSRPNHLLQWPYILAASVTFSPGTVYSPTRMIAF